MKIKIQTGLVSMVMFAAFVIAEGQVTLQRPSVEERTKRVVDTLTVVLKLDQSQQSQAQNTFMEYYKESDRFREAVQAGTVPEKAQFEKIATDRDDKLKKFLTADQLKKFKEDIEPVIVASRRASNN